MHKAKRVRKNNKRLLAMSLVTATATVTVSSIIVFNAINKLNNDSTKNTDKSLLSSEYTSKNQAVEVIQQDTTAVPTSADENAVENKISAIPKIAKGTDFSQWNNSCHTNLVVVNKDNPIPNSYKANIIDYKNIKINATIKTDLDNMINAAAKAGAKIYPSSGYRSVERQTTLFNNQVSKNKKQGYKSGDAEIKAATVVARPKTSEHHTGLAIDFNGVKDDFYKTKEYTWLIKNAADYGFILRYPKNKTDVTNVVYEPWHFRYVGKEHAKKIVESGLCYEEYIEKIMKK